MKKILIVSYTFYPDNNPRCLRWQALGEEFVKLGYEVHVLTNQQSSLMPFKIFGRKRVKAVSVNESLVSIQASKLSFTKASLQKLKKSLKKVLKLFVWPDFSAQWIPWSIFKLFLISRSHNYERIISSSHPMSGHVPVFLLKKLGLLKSSYWILDIGDPFGLIDYHNMNNLRLYKNLNFSFEKSICELCNLVTVTTESTRELYIYGYKLNPNKVVLAPPVLSLDLNSAIQSVSPYLAETKNIIFAGTFYKALRNPTIVLEFASFLQEKYPDQFMFHFFGALNDCAEYFEKPLANVNVYGLVDRKKLQPYFNHCDAVINVGNASKYQLPSKIVEAVASCKFIFNFCTQSEDSSTEFLKSYPGYFNIYSNNDFLQALDSFEKSLVVKDEINKASAEIITKHSPQDIVHTFLKS